MPRKRRKAKTKRLSYIEETPKHYSTLKRVVSKGVVRSVESSKEEGHYVTYTQGSTIIREYPGGHTEIIGHVENGPIPVKIGTKFTLH